MSLLVLVVYLDDCSRDFVDRQLLNFHLRSAKMNVEVFAVAISIFRLFWNDLFVQLIVVVHLMVMRDLYPRVLYLKPHRLLEFSWVESVVLVTLEHEDMFAHAIWTVTGLSSCGD